jgi:transposase
MTSETPESPDKRQRRRRYDPAFKRAIVEQTLTPGASVARIAREHGINANQLFKWRRQYLLGTQDAQSASLLPVTLAADEPVPNASTSPVSAPDAGQIEITLAGGTVRVQGAVDAATLQQVLSSLRQ